MEHSPTSATGTGWEATPWRETQREEGTKVILTVADLIVKLRQMPQDAMVLARDGVVVDVMEIAGHVQMLTAATDDDADDERNLHTVFEEDLLLRGRT